LHLYIVERNDNLIKKRARPAKPLEGERKKYNQMEFFKKIGILLILFIVGLTIETCNKEVLYECNCPESKYECSILSFSVDQVNEDDLSRRPIPESLECRKDFALVFKFDVERTFIAKCKPVHSLFLQSAFACSCYSPSYLKESIISIQVFSDKDFGETHPAGTDIAELFKILIGGTKLLSFEDFIELPDITSYLRFACVLTETSIDEGEYEFTFVVNLADERSYEQSVKNIFK